MKIISLIPSATEILCALGLEDNIYGVSHECDFPESIKNKKYQNHKESKNRFNVLKYEGFIIISL